MGLKPLSVTHLSFSDCPAAFLVLHGVLAHSSRLDNNWGIHSWPSPCDRMHQLLAPSSSVKWQRITPLRAMRAEMAQSTPLKALKTFWLRALCSNAVLTGQMCTDTAYIQLILSLTMGCRVSALSSRWRSPDSYQFVDCSFIGASFSLKYCEMALWHL
jgi:hypothetical protein